MRGDDAYNVYIAMAHPYSRSPFPRHPSISFFFLGFLDCFLCHVHRYSAVNGLAWLLASNIQLIRYWVLSISRYFLHLERTDLYFRASHGIYRNSKTCCTRTRVARRFGYFYLIHFRRKTNRVMCTGAENLEAERHELFFILQTRLHFISEFKITSEKYTPEYSL